MGETGNKTMYNIGGGVLGALLAGLAVFGLVHSQQQPQPQEHSAQISYEG